MSITSFISSIRNIMRMDAGLSGDAQRIEQLAWMLFLKIYDDLESDWAYDGNYSSRIPEPCRWSNWADTENPEGLKGDALLNFVNNTLLPGLGNITLPENCLRRQSIVKEIFENGNINNYMKDGVQFRHILKEINAFDFADPRTTHAFGEIYETILKQLQAAGSAGEFYTPRALTDFIASHLDLKIGDKIADFACGTGGFLNSARKYLDKGNLSNRERQILNTAFFGIEKKPMPYLLCLTNLLLNQVADPMIMHDNALTQQHVFNYGPQDAFDVILMNPPYGGSENAGVQQNFPEDQRSAETADLFLILIMARLRKKTGRAAVIVPDGFLFGSGNKTAIKKRLLTEYNLHTVIRLPNSVFAPYTSIATNILFFNADGPTKETWFYRVDMPEGYKHFSKTRPMLPEHFAELNAWWQNRVERETGGAPKAKAWPAQTLLENNCQFDLCGFLQKEEEILPPHELITQYQAKRAEHVARIDEALAQIMAAIGEQA